MLGLEAGPDEGKSQIAHGETVRETANMISFMADVIGIRDDMFYAGMPTCVKWARLDEGHPRACSTRPRIVNLQCDIDHPTQAMLTSAGSRTLWRPGKPKGKKTP